GWIDRASPRGEGTPRGCQPGRVVRSRDVTTGSLVLPRRVRSERFPEGRAGRRSRTRFLVGARYLPINDSAETTRPRRRRPRPMHEAKPGSSYWSGGPTTLT